MSGIEELLLSNQLAIMHAMLAQMVPVAQIENDRRVAAILLEQAEATARELEKPIE